MENAEVARGLLPAGAPRLGLGCGDLYGGVAEPASLRLLHAAYDHGIRWFDVARLYGNGQAEQVMGRAFAGRRDQVVIVSKAGIVPWSMQTAARLRRKALTTATRLAPFARAVLPEPPPARERYGAFAPAELRKSVERSLRALRTDHLDVLMLHECELPDATRPETLSLLQRLRTEGKVRAFGIATRFPQAQSILQAGPDRFAAAQFPSDIFSRNEGRLPPAWRGLTITHSILKGALPRLDGERRDGLAGLLLQDALASHDGVVLFTTSRPERIAEAVEAARRPARARLSEFLDQPHLPREAADGPPPAASRGR